MLAVSGGECRRDDARTAGTSVSGRGVARGDGAGSSRFAAFDLLPAVRKISHKTTAAMMTAMIHMLQPH